jgi:hypothetical protein
LLEPLYVELDPIHEEVSLAKADPVTPIERPSPEPKDLEEGFQPCYTNREHSLVRIPFLEDNIFEDFGNTSNYGCQKRPPVLVTPSESLDKEFLKESIKELTAIMSSEWSKEVEHSF